MDRPVFTAVFEEDEIEITDRVISNIDDSWRKEKGDFMYDAVAATPLEVKQLQVNQDTILKNAFAQFAEGEWLDLKLSEEGMSRYLATPTKRSLSVTAAAGVQIKKGQKMSVVIMDSNSNPITYTVDSDILFDTAGTLTANITCLTAGTIGNVPIGSSFIFSPPVAGISTIVDAGITTLGTDTESDEIAWQRYQDKKSKPSSGGNKYDYERWASDIAGVGKAKCIPRWDGNGTVKVVIVDINFEPASDSLVLQVQNYIDPGSTGKGEGKAPCGAQVTVVKATQINIDITATVTYAAGYNVLDVKADFISKVVDYLQDKAFIDDSTVVYNKIGAFLISTDGVTNYTNLIVNGGTADVPVGVTAIAAMGTVTI